MNLKTFRTGVDFIFAPGVADMYTPSHRCYVVPEGFEHLAEGKSRPGHFKGVATIVTKLFGIVQPTKVRKERYRTNFYI